MIKLTDIIELIEPLTVIGARDRQVERVASVINERENLPGDLYWVSEKNIAALSEITNGAVLCPTVDGFTPNEACTYLCVANPRQAFQQVLEHFFVQEPIRVIAHSARIADSSVIGKRVTIGEYTIIEEDCSIGDDCVIGHGTVIHKGSVLEDSVKVGSNSVIGGVGFGYERGVDGDYRVIPHLGNVVLKKNVEVGNCTCIDRAVLGSTILEENVKVDNLVHIGHGVQVGRNSLIIANSMIGGSTVIGQNVWVAPSASLLNKIAVEDDVVIGMGAVIIRDIEKGKTVVGNPGKNIG